MILSLLIAVSIFSLTFVSFLDGGLGLNIEHQRCVVFVEKRSNKSWILELEVELFHYLVVYADSKDSKCGWLLMKWLYWKGFKVEGVLTPR